MFKKKEPVNWRKSIEITNLKAPTSKEVKALVKHANAESYYGVCLLHNNLLLADKCRYPTVKLITVAGSPPIGLYRLIPTDRKYKALLGYYNRDEIDKIKDICQTSIADELDIIFPFYWYARGYKKRIIWFINGVKKRFKKPIKVIIELGTLVKTEEDIKNVCSLLSKCNIDFVKTNSGLIPQPSHISLPMGLRELKKHTKYPIKASGGIRTLKDIQSLLTDFGVTRIGTSRVEQ